MGSVRDVKKENWGVVQRNEYLPFGTPLRQSVAESRVQPYKFGGKEFDRMHGLDWYDFHARQYDPVLARFHTIDPLAEKYYSISPYAYCANNPINAIDPDGKKIVFITKIAGKITHLEYTSQGNLRNASTGKTYDGSKIGGHIGKIVEGYNNMLNSGDANYVKQLTTLIDSDNTHHIDATKISESSVAAGAKGESTDASLKKAAKGESVGTYTTYDFSSDELSGGLKKTNKTTVAHEVQHQYDYEKGNMKDSFDKNGKLIKGGSSPAEKRAIKNEDKGREQEKLPKRTTY